MEAWRKEFDVIVEKLDKEAGWKLRDKRWRIFSGKIYKIQDKAGKTVPFVPTDIQARMFDGFQANKKVIVLKARQIMCTTLVMIMFLDDCLFEDNMEARTIADDEGTIEKLFKRVQFAYDMLPKFLKVFFPLSASNKYELKIKNRNSHYQVCLGTHGDTVRRLHFSEVAFIQSQHVAKRVSESLETVPQNGDTLVVMESIANGGDGVFAETYKQSVNGENEYRALFFRWYDHYEYTEECDETKKKMILDSLDEREKKLIKEGVSVEQIAWRRTKIRSMMGATYEDKLELFLVKYPENDKDCFLLTGMQVFSPRLIDIYRAEPDTCYLKSKKIYGFNMLDVFVESGAGEILVYEEPEQGKQYVIGADVSDGTSKGDRSKAFVLELGTSKIMAFYDAQNTKPETFGSRLCTLGIYYNNAELAIESNFRDSCVKEAIRRRYPNVYYHGKEEGKLLRSWGWNTNDRSKRLIIDQFKYDFETRIWDALSEKLLDEMEHYVEMPNGRTEAGANYFDDMIMSFAIGNYLALKLPSFQNRASEAFVEKEYSNTLNKDKKSEYYRKKKGVNVFNASGGI